MKLPIIIFLIVLIISSLLKILPILNGNFPFTMDQGRDMLDLRNIIVGHHLTLIGPTTSINGVFLGPFWYYFNLLPFLIGRGDPTYLVYWNLFWYQAIALVSFALLARKNLIFGLITTSLFLMTPVFFYSSRFSWSANPMPFFSLIFFTTLIILDRKDRFKYILVGLICGLSLQIEAALGVLFFPFTLLWLILSRTNLRLIALTSLGFLITLLPQIFFELRHSFLMTQTLINEFSGRTSILGPSLNLMDTFNLHLKNYLGLVDNLIILPGQLAAAAIPLSIIYLGWKLTRRQLSPIIQSAFLSSLLFLVFSFTAYLFYHYPLKGWFLLGLHLPYLFILTAALTELFNSKLWLAKIIVILLIGASFRSTFLSQSRLIPTHQNDRSSDPSNFRNQLEVVDLVYLSAKGQPFKVYNYIPSVYDFPYQYLFWWYGTNKYHYQPDTITYLDNVPEYINNNSQFWTRKRLITSTDYPTFLIYQLDNDHPDRLNAWLNNFEKLCLKEATTLEYSTIIQLKTACPH